MVMTNALAQKIITGAKKKSMSGSKKAKVLTLPLPSLPTRKTNPLTATQKSTLGPLTNVPPAYNTCQCLKCRSTFHLFSRAICKCAWKSKYKNMPVDVAGFKFDSLKEARRFSKLKALAARNFIHNLQVHPSYSLDVNLKHICKYEADFSYNYNQHFIIEDVKGTQTPEFKLKAKLLKAIYGWDIEII